MGRTWLQGTGSSTRRSQGQTGLLGRHPGPSSALPPPSPPGNSEPRSRSPGRGLGTCSGLPTPSGEQGKCPSERPREPEREREAREARAGQGPRVYRGSRKRVRALLSKDWEVKQTRAAWTPAISAPRPHSEPPGSRGAGGGRQRSGVCPQPPARSALGGEGASTWLSWESERGARGRSGGCPGGGAALGATRRESKREAVLRAGGSRPGCWGPRGAPTRPGSRGPCARSGPARSQAQGAGRGRVRTERP